MFFAEICMYHFVFSTGISQEDIIYVHQPHPSFVRIATIEDRIKPNLDYIKNSPLTALVKITFSGTFAVYYDPIICHKIYLQS